ncbi:hypothetical protein Ddye_025009 [Dipteronia dyeriana]|uniref:Uncharacterized protein n=1 Tax=Dipteronia dyeriana TaxID=168575 RepID=A0AAD9WU52_9ROSI|nr:hypothetical protein Ddye_025009 [Dipteronia dyeriana]
MKKEICGRISQTAHRCYNWFDMNYQNPNSGNSNNNTGAQNGNNDHNQGTNSHDNHAQGHFAAQNINP